MQAAAHLLTAPFEHAQRMVRCIQRVADSARAGRPARIVAKVNALTDPP
jgi:polyphosphate kinase